uniref:PHO85 cyclin-9 n=1 Tax=Anthurium amnicola TaxID=1678845 RepID=A0A1D1XMR9_9ARAE
MSGSPCSNAEYKPLSSSVTDFIAESMCGILDTHQPPRCYNWDFVPLPELVLFVKKVTLRAKVDVQTAIAALILVARFKERLPKNAHGEYGTTHKIFLSALLIASKEFMSYDDEDGCRPYSSAPPTCCSSPTPADELPPNSNLLDDSSSNYSSSNFSNSPPSDFDHSHNILSTTPSSTTSSMMSDDDVHDMLSNNTSSHRKNRRHNTINLKLAEISGIYTLQEVNQMERDFLKYLGHHNNWVSDKDIRDFVENNKYALGIC